MEGSHQHYAIGGCNVLFPHKAYGVQLAFVGRVIAALEGGKNALLEAPTGSGKTLSLLCSALAWQARERQRIEEGILAEVEAARAAAEGGGTGASPDKPAGPAASCGNDGQGCGGGCGGQQVPAASEHQPASGKRLPPQLAYEDGGASGGGDVCSSGGKAGGSGTGNGAAAAGVSDPGDAGFLRDSAQEEGVPPAAPSKRKPPKIFYATRTHSQIAQVVKELKRSGYKPRMAVLGSRKHYCVNKHVQRSKASTDEACEELLKEGQCAYFKNYPAFTSSALKYSVMDIEDLRKAGASHKACPYYTSRKWAEEAELIFCPYSYLADPVIRRAMSIDVTGAILIFDEAHNIEDVCREAASVEVDLPTMAEVHGAFVKAAQFNGKPEVYQPLADACNKVLCWMSAKEQAAVEAATRAGGRQGGQQSRFEVQEVVRSGPAVYKELEEAGLGPDQVDLLWECYQAAREEDEAMGNNAKGGGGEEKKGKENQGGDGSGGSAPPGGMATRVGALALGIMSRLVQVVRMVFQVSDDGGRDYRLVSQRYYQQGAAGQGPGGRGGGNDRFRRRGDDELGLGPGFTINLCLWCLNPAVAFKQVADICHSVVLTSGTLAPLDGFASELGAPFGVRLEAPHVVDMKKQVWAGIVGQGPGGITLSATYQNQNQTAFQDAVGRLLEEACGTIPDGVLFFLPSYGLLDKLVARWKSTGAWARLGALKHVVSEPRGGGQEELKTVMKAYYDAIDAGKGGLFLAVCRGKVSEGLDFADRRARGVIILGIPFPAVKDTKVNEKKRFNDSTQRQLGVVSGETWYSQQAFRALNQAVGRCIRHRLDWGAILLVDDRFKQPRNQRMLSRWVRGALVVHPGFEAAMQSMQGFFHTLQADPPGAAAAAAAAAAGAGAGGVGAQPAGPTLQQLVAAGRPPLQLTLGQGRGAEGAREGWVDTQAAAVAAAAPAMHDVWQGRPLGQARMDSFLMAPIDAANQQHIKQEQVQLQIKQEQRGCADPHQQAAASAAAAAPSPLQHTRRDYQPSSGDEAFFIRPRSSGAAAAATPGTAAQLDELLLRGAPLARWAAADAAEATAYLLTQPLLAGMPAEEVADMGRQGVLECFEVGLEYLQKGRALHHLAGTWSSALPRGMQAVMSAGPAAFPDGPAVDPAARAFGEQQLRGWPQHQLLQAMRQAYRSVLRPRGDSAQAEAAEAGLQPGARASGEAQQHHAPPQQQQQQQVKEEDAPPPLAQFDSAEDLHGQGQALHKNPQPVLPVQPPPHHQQQQQQQRTVLLPPQQHQPAPAAWQGPVYHQQQYQQQWHQAPLPASYQQQAVGMQPAPYEYQYHQQQQLPQPGPYGMPPQHYHQQQYHNLQQGYLEAPGIGPPGVGLPPLAHMPPAPLPPPQHWAGPAPGPQQQPPQQQPHQQQQQYQHGPPPGPQQHMLHGVPAVPQQQWRQQQHYQAGPPAARQQQYQQQQYQHKLPPAVQQWHAPQHMQPAPLVAAPTAPQMQPVLQLQPSKRQPPAGPAAAAPPAQAGSEAPAAGAGGGGEAGAKQGQKRKYMGANAAAAEAARQRAAAAGAGQAGGGADAAQRAAIAHALADADSDDDFQ